MMKAVPKEVIEPMIERIPLRRLGQPEDIANAYVFPASDETICLYFPFHPEKCSLRPGAAPGRCISEACFCRFRWGR